MAQCRVLISQHVGMCARFHPTIYIAESPLAGMGGVRSARASFHVYFLNKMRRLHDCSNKGRKGKRFFDKLGFKFFLFTPILQGFNKLLGWFDSSSTSALVGPTLRTIGTSPIPFVLNVAAQQRSRRMNEMGYRALPKILL